mgnify:CR=1 FL=1
MKYVPTPEQLTRRQLVKDMKRRYAAITEAIRATKDFRSLPGAFTDGSLKWPYPFTSNLTSLQEHATVLCMMRAHMRGRLHVTGQIYKKKTGHKVYIGSMDDQAKFIKAKTADLARFFKVSFQNDVLLDTRTADPTLVGVFQQIVGEPAKPVVSRYLKVAQTASA